MSGARAKTTKPPVPCGGPACRWQIKAAGVGAVVAHAADCPNPEPVEVN